MTSKHVAQIECDWITRGRVQYRLRKTRVMNQTCPDCEGRTFRDTARGRKWQLCKRCGFAWPEWTPEELQDATGPEGLTLAALIPRPTDNPNWPTWEREYLKNRNLAPRT